MHLKRLREVLAILLFITSAYSCTENREFSRTYPYTIESVSFRDYKTTIMHADKLSEIGLNAYIKPFYSSKEGVWFKILIGAEKEKKDILYNKIRYENYYNIHNFKIADFSDIEYDIINSKTTASYVHFKRKKNFRIQETYYEMLNKLPYSDNYIVKNLIYTNNSTASNSMFYSFKLPIGIVNRYLRSISDIRVEVTYSNLIYDKEIVLYLAKVHPNVFLPEIVNTLTISIAHYYNDRAKSYPYALNDLRMIGNIVEISRHKDNKEYLFIGYSLIDNIFFLIHGNRLTTKSDIINLTNSNDSKNNLLRYHDIRSSLSMVGKNLQNKNSLNSLHYNYIYDWKGDNAKFYLGNISLKYVFKDSAMNLWSLESIIFNRKKEAEEMFERDYTPVYNDKNSIKIQDTKGWIIYTLYTDSYTKKRKWMPTTIEFNYTNKIHVLSVIRNKDIIDENYLIGISKNFLLD